MTVPLELVAVGEAMLQVAPTDDSQLVDADTFRMHLAGAEVNVAVGLARLGHRTGVVTRVGDDPLGERIIATLSREGVDVSTVERDGVLPTGVYFKDPRRAGSTSHYYRWRSAATALDARHARLASASGARILHLSGITPALSTSCRELAERLAAEPRPTGQRLAFDVNHRQTLWDDADAAPSLLGLARRADIVFVGRDEAESLWATPTAEAIRDLLPAVPTLVVKDGPDAATCFREGAVTRVPALAVDVVEPIGAGDAFAAGFLAGELRAMAPAVCLRWGHVLAARALRSRADQPSAPPGELLDRVASMDAAVWRSGAACQDPYLRGPVFDGAIG